MRGANWKRTLLALLSGSMMFQVTGCTETAIYISTGATVVTAGGLIYLISRVLD